MRYRVSELEGDLLDEAVAKCEGAVMRECNYWSDCGAHVTRNAFTDDTRHSHITDDEWAPSERWDHAGPIIERELIAVYHEQFAVQPATAWVAGFDLAAEDGSVYSEYTSDPASISLEHAQSGPTPLIAAMRAYVASKFGDEIELDVDQKQE